MSIFNIPGLTQLRRWLPGVMITLLIAIAARFLSDHYQTPTMLLALLLGMAVNFLSDNDKTIEGIDFASKVLLRWGVALLGLRITFEQIYHVGWEPLLLVLISVIATIFVSVFLARMIGLNPFFGLLSGGATAICGVSAALAISSSLPTYQKKNDDTILTVILVSSLSTMAMIFYPVAVVFFELNSVQTGIFLGGSIHDVAQVIGAGYAISHESGDYATVVKLLRVSLLIPVVLIATAWGQAVFRNSIENTKKNILTQSTSQVPPIDIATNTQKPPLLPWFLVLFVLLVLINSLGILPHAINQSANTISQWMLIIAMSALGIKTKLKELLEVGIKPILLMVFEALFLASLLLILIRWTSV